MCGERQIHGFIYERLVFENDNLVSDILYTSKWDGVEILDGIETSVSVKYLKKGSSIELSDFRRKVDIDHDFILYVGFWVGDITNIVKGYKVLIYKENWKKYFGDISIIDTMYDDLKTISNSYDDDDKWKSFVSHYKKLYGNAIVALRFKRDHKKQKRIQCAISNKNFFNVVLKENKILL